MDCLGCDLSTMLPDGSIYCAAIDGHVSAESSCDLWCDDVFTDSLEEYAQEEE